MQWLNQNAGFGRWQADHAYAIGEACFSSVIGDYKYMECTIAGTTAAAEPTWPAVGNTIADGTVTWVVRDIRQGTAIGRIPALVDVGGGKAGLPAVSGKLLTDISGMPIGSVVPFLATKAQPGWLALDTGALISRTTYAELWAWVQSNAPLISDADWQAQAAAQTSVGAYSTGDGNTTFRLPRILDYVRGGLTAEVGAWQGDAIRNITGTFHDMCLPAEQTGAFYQKTNTAPQANGNSNTGSIVGFDASRVVPTADENRPKTIKMLYCVKAFDATANQGLIDITALANEVAGKQNTFGYARFWDEKANGTGGGTFTAGAWRTRTLNKSENNNLTSTSLSNNQITLPAGTYLVSISCPGCGVNGHKSRLQNITTSATALVGSTEQCSGSASGEWIQTSSLIKGILNLSAQSNVLEVQHYSQETFATGGFGSPTAVAGDVEIYTIAEFTKIG